MMSKGMHRFSEARIQEAKAVRLSLMFERAGKFLTARRVLEMVA